MSNSADASSATRGGIMFASITACQHHNLYQKKDIHERIHVDEKLVTHPWITLNKKQAELGQAICRMKYSVCQNYNLQPAIWRS
jgi:hypothetical protein